MRNINWFFKDTSELFLYFEKRGMVLDIEDPLKHRVFINNKSKVLFVAHLDTVCKPKIVGVDDVNLYAQGLDDRLGLFMIMSLLNDGITADVLLTDHEETSKSTAQYHKCKEYNWIVEFDRAGTDFVTYELSCPSLDLELMNYSPRAIGAFSDICFLETKSACFNWGIGYQLAHSKDSYCVMADYRSQYSKFKEFYYANIGKSYKQSWDIPVFRSKFTTYRPPNKGKVRVCDCCWSESPVKFNEYADMFLCKDCWEFYASKEPIWGNF